MKSQKKECSAKNPAVAGPKAQPALKATRNAANAVVETMERYTTA